MRQRSGLGCGTIAGVSVFGGLGLLFLVTGITDAPNRLVLMAMSFPGLFVSAWLLYNDLRNGALRRQMAAAQTERQLLSVAARHGGHVSPAMVTMEVPGMDIATAKAELDALAKQGFCTVDSDDEGRPFYTFPLGHREKNEASPEEWVRQVSGAQPQSRMTGAQADPDSISAEH